jgi:TIR domain
MKVFISWSGERSKALGELLRSWLPLVLHYADPWLSQADIEAGQRWAEQVAKELEGCNFGILCITRENVSSPWVLFEAGALAKSMQESRVIPLLLDLDFRDITGPLAQFQAKKLEKQGLFEVVLSLNQTCQHPAPEERVKLLFDALWPDLEAKISQIPKGSTPQKHSRSQPEILEELVSSVRTLDGRLREVSEEGPRGMRSRRRRFPSMMLREVMHMVGDKPGDPIALLVFASMFKEEAPWLYELGAEAYRASKSKNQEEGRAARRRFQRVLSMVGDGPFFHEEFGLDPKMGHMLMREFERFSEFEGEEPNRKEKSRAVSGAPSATSENGAEKSN